MEGAFLVLLNSNKHKNVNTMLKHFLLILFCLPFLFVFYWMIMSSFKPTALHTAIPPVWFFKPTLIHFKKVFTETRIWDNIVNSIIISVMSTIIGVAVGTLSAYSIARYRQKILILVILIVRIIPYSVCMIPLYLFFRDIDLLNTLLGIILSHLLITIPFSTIILISFMEDVPLELEEAAYLDGASTICVFFTIIIRLVTPGIIGASIINFIFSWNNLLFALVLGGPDTVTAPVLVYNYVGIASYDWGGMAASATILTIPALIFVAFTFKQLMSGLTMGAVKG